MSIRFLIIFFLLFLPVNAAKKISELDAVTTPATGDLIPVVDVSDTSESAAGTTKKITWGNFFTGSNAATALAANPADCSANQYANAINASGTLACAQPTHANLASLSADDHTQYALLAGRSGGQTLIGGTASGNSITLQATSNATKGAIIHSDKARFDSQAYFNSEIDNGNSSTADTIDWTVGNKQKSTLTGNCTYTFTAPTGPTNIILRVIQSSGSNTVTWPAAVKWSGGAPTLSTGASAVDIVSCYYNGTNYYCKAGLNFQ